MPTPLFNRTKRNFNLAQLRKKAPFEQLGEVDQCCDRMLVLAHISDNSTWKNDVNSRFTKLVEDSDTCLFVLKKNNVNIQKRIPNFFSSWSYICIIIIIL